MSIWYILANIMHFVENFMANIIEKEKHFAKAKYVCVWKILICKMDSEHLVIGCFPLKFAHLAF